VTITVTIKIGGQPLIAELDDDALAVIAEAINAKRKPEPEYLDTKQAAARLGLTVPTLEKLKQRGHIPYTQEAPGQKVWYARRDLDAWQPNPQREETG
jgi:excisionase family DNA binding protein